MKKKVLLLLLKGFEEYEAAVFTDVLGWSRSDGLEGVDVDTVGLTKQVNGTWNLRVLPEYQLNEINVSDYDALAIPGGFEEKGYYEEAYDDRILNLIREFDTQSKIIAAICVAALPVGKSCILENRKATTYHLGGKRRKQLAEFGVHVQDKRLVEDGNVITCTGPGPALDVVFLLLERLTSIKNVETVKTAMGF